MWVVEKDGEIIGYFRRRTDAERFAAANDGFLRKCDS